MPGSRDLVVRLATSIYLPDAVLQVLNARPDVSVTTTDDQIQLATADHVAEDLPPDLAELLNQALRASIESRLPVLRPEDE